MLRPVAGGEKNMARGCMILVLAVSALTISGCPVPQDQNTPVVQRREIDPVSGRAYWIYVPSNYTHSRPWPVIVTCHGTPPYDVAEYHIREWKMLGEVNGCIIVAPELIATDGIFGDGPVVGMLDDERFILSILSLLGYRRNIDRSNIMITGFSGGGFPMYWVGLRNPSIFSCVVARSCNFSEHNLDGWYPPEAALSQSVMVYVGEGDLGAITAQTDAAIAYLRSKGFQVETKVIPNISHERVPENAMDFFRRHMRPTVAVR
jgi:poly(3-hydroxybutyrate) depolymerase